MLTTDLVFESALTRLRKAKVQLKHEAGIEGVLVPSSQRGRSRLHIKVFDSTDPVGYCQMVCRKLMHIKQLAPETVSNNPAMRCYLLMMLGCGTRDLFSYSIEIGHDLIRLTRSLKMTVIVSVFPVEE